MEISSITKIMKHGSIEIPENMLLKMGDKLKITSLNNVWLLITRLNENHMEGESLLFDEEKCAYLLPESQLSALELKQGDDIKLIYSDELEFIILKKINTDTIN